MGTALVRTDPKGRNYQTLLHEDLFAPLKMDSTSMGLRADLKDAPRAPGHARHRADQASLRAISRATTRCSRTRRSRPRMSAAPRTAGDLWRFAEMLRRGGELDGVRILSPAHDRASRARSIPATCPTSFTSGVALRAGWEVPPANQGLGFQVRGTGVFHHLFGQLASPETFGNYGAGSTMFWVDPEADVSFACLSAGVMTQAANIERCRKLSDIALSAMI